MRFLVSLFAASLAENVGGEGDGNETVTCYQCIYGIILDSNTVFNGTVECDKTPSSVPNGTLTVPKYTEIKTDTGMVKVENVCYDLGKMYKQRLEFKPTPDSQLNVTSQTVYYRARGIFPVMQNSTLCGYEGKLFMEQVAYGCGSQTSTCSEKLTPHPHVHFSKEENPCANCGFIKIRNAATGKLTPVNGDPKCADAIPQSNPVCSSKEPSVSLTNSLLHNSFPSQSISSDSDSGLCETGLSALYIPGHKEPDLTEQIRMCNSESKVPNMFFYKMEGEGADLAICASDECNGKQ